MKSEVAKLKKQGLTHREIAKRLGFKSPTSVTQYLWDKIKITKKARGVEIYVDTGEEITLEQMKILEKILKLMENF
jgi:hypothetical protein